MVIEYLAHDVMLVGTGWGRVKDVIINDDNSATIILMKNKL